jgi:glycosyltransferase involved in cell wall biosynthesis
MKEYIEDVEFLPYPAIQNKIKIDFPEERNIILWSRRGILGHLLNIDDVTQRPFRWIASQLKKHTSLEFHIVSAEESEGVDFELLFNSSRKYLLEFKNRIHIHKNLSWLEMQKLYLKTKIVINPKGFCFENGDIEASATGIPIVLDSSIEMSDPSFLIKEWNTSKYYDTLEQLLENKNFYLEKSRFYYNFVNKYHTYQSYTDNLYKILEQRKLV